MLKEVPAGDVQTVVKKEILDKEDALEKAPRISVSSQETNSLLQSIIGDWGGELITVASLLHHHCNQGASFPTSLTSRSLE